MTEGKREHTCRVGTDFLYFANDAVKGVHNSGQAIVLFGIS